MSDKKSPDNTSANPMWGGQYATGPAEIMEQINASIGFDKALYAQDIEGSLAHARMLADAGILTSGDLEKINGGLLQIMDEIEDDKFDFKTELEDIHMNIEARLKELIGEAAGRLHTGRSRNDQVATDLRLFVRDAIDSIDFALQSLQVALVHKASDEAATVMPGFTHLQTAQPVTFGHHLMAYAEMSGRDRSRFADCRARLNESPLGAAALAGTSFPIDRDSTAEALEFDRPMANSLDAVASRDFALEFLSACSICMTHLSRLAEEMVFWSSPLVGFIKFTDAFSTGSSIMPQKRNPDAAELIRGKVGRVLGAFQGMAVTLKALPLAYNKDMQEDKEPVFDAYSSVLLAVSAMAGLVGDMQPNREAMREAAGSGYSTATDLADWLVREMNIPFREAHHITARIVQLATEKNVTLEQLPLDAMQTVEPRITPEAKKVLSVEESVASRVSYGGTAPANVRKQVERWKERLS